MKLPKRTTPREASPGKFFHFELDTRPFHLRNGVIRQFHYDAILWNSPNHFSNYLPLTFIFEYTQTDWYNLYKLSKEEIANIYDEALTLLLLCDPFKEHEHLC